MARLSIRRRGVAAVVPAGVFAAITLLTAAATPAPSPPGARAVARRDLRVMAGIEQLYVVGAAPGDHIEVSRRGGPGITRGAAASGVADRFGSLAVRELEGGAEYRVRNVTSGQTLPAKVLAPGDNPPQSFYDSTTMHEGLNYIPMRDGVTLAATVRPPLGQTLADGPFPTLIEYSGYQIAAPAEPLYSKLASLLGRPADPLAPATSTDVGSLLMRLAGFAVVSVQMRGSGCSGGESDLFDYPSRYDGYDAVETVAAQRWVQHHAVGMVGISFSGFSQIATASTRPPHLAAIAPMSFVGSLYDIGHPGGIFNNGFAQSWLAERQENARPAPDPGALPYANVLVKHDPICRDNQRLRLQTRDAISLVSDHDLTDAIYERRDFRPWMREITVPTFASLQFNDEETGPYAILSAGDLLAANPRVWLNLSNGHHRDAVNPATITRLMEFLDIYVARRAPQPKLLVTLLSDVIWGAGSVKPALMDVVPKFSEAFRWSVDSARAAFEATPRVTVMLGLQRGMNEGRNTGAQWRFTAGSFPVEGSVERTWYLGDGGRLVETTPTAATASYRSDPAVRPATSGTAGVRRDDPVTDITWTPMPSGDGIGFVTDVLDQDVVALGPAAARIRLRSDAPDTDVAITVSEVRPDGSEMLVSSGVQRASVRHIDAQRSTPTRPAFTNDRHEPLDGSTVTVPLQILPIGHVFRVGSRIRIALKAVGGDSERWAFRSVDPAGSTVRNTVQLGGPEASSVTLTVAPQRGFPAKRLACPAAGMPCRPYVPASNGG